MCDCTCYKPEKEDTRIYCSVADQACRGPNAAGNSVRTECFVCGEPVCTACSSKRKYFKYGLKRICNPCQVMMLDNNDYDKHVMPRLRNLVLGKEHVYRPN